MLEKRNRLWKFSDTQRLHFWSLVNDVEIMAPVDLARGRVATSSSVERPIAARNDSLYDFQVFSA